MQQYQKNGIVAANSAKTDKAKEANAAMEKSFLIMTNIFCERENISTTY